MRISHSNDELCQRNVHHSIESYQDLEGFCLQLHDNQIVVDGKDYVGRGGKGKKHAHLTR